ncbi:MAG: class I adenylate-forming enzyme family protein [Planctomycetota bacterium]
MSGSCNLSDFLRRSAQVHRTRPAVLSDDAPGGTLSYEQLDALVDALASSLRLDRGERVLTLCENHWRYLALHFAIARSGAITVPMSPRATPTEIRHVAERIESRRCVGDLIGAESLRSASLVPTDLESLLDRAEPLGSTTTPAQSEPETDDGHAALLYFTSGTTGQPKGVVLTHHNAWSHALAAIHEVGLDENSVWGHYAPMFHLADAWAIWAVTAAGGAHVFEPRFDAIRTWRSMQRLGVTVTNLVPTMLQRMLHADRPDPATLSMRCLLSGGAPIAPSVVEELEDAFGARYMQTYGMTETSPYLTITGHEVLDRCRNRRERAERAARTGRPFLGVDLRVVDEVGTAIPADDRAVGEIQVRGPSVTPGYWQDPKATREAFTEDGYLRTGDLATLDGNGSVRIVDRRKDVILSGGETIYSTEVEHRLLEHPDVQLAAVFAIPDEDLGERVCAAFVPARSRDPDPSELREFCREVLSGPKVPRQWFRLDDLPRTPSGKISKRELRHRFEEG